MLVLVTSEGFQLGEQGYACAGGWVLLQKGFFCGSLKACTGRWRAPHSSTLPKNYGCESLGRSGVQGPAKSFLTHHPGRHFHALTFTHWGVYGHPSESVLPGRESRDRVWFKASACWGSLCTEPRQWLEAYLAAGHCRPVCHSSQAPEHGLQ